MTTIDSKGLVIPIVVIPLRSCKSAAQSICGIGTLILNSLSDLALSVAGTPARFLAYCSTARKFYEISGSVPGEMVGYNTNQPYCLRPLDSLRELAKPERIRGLAGVFMNASFLISEQPPYKNLCDAALADGLCCCGNPCTGDLYAFSIRFQDQYADHLHQKLRQLVIQLDAGVPDAIQANPALQLPPSHAGSWNSPAMKDCIAAQGFRVNDAPLYLNTALEEACFHDGFAASDRVIRNASSLTAALVELRQESRVPWIFNELINEADYRTGAVEPASLPVELHLASTAACNIECRFCSIVSDARFHTPARLQDIQKLDFLPYLRALRLSSGNGEPTLNMDLTAIISWLHKTYPHLCINFFTNGVLLDHNQLIPSLVSSQTSWINVSLNASNRKLYQSLCQADHFDRVCNNLKRLRDEKQGSRSVSPLVFASMVLTRDTVSDLPNMPALCRELGVDRFVAFPFFALGVDMPGRYTEDHAYHHSRHIYDQVYEATVGKAREFNVTVELPAPVISKRTAFAVEPRIVHDFAGIERNEWALGKLLCSFRLSARGRPYCAFLWRTASVGCAVPGQTQRAKHWLYPCIGPLASISAASQLLFPFPDKAAFKELWNNPLFRFLRESQHQSRRCEICDACRGCDTRQPNVVKEMKRLVARFVQDQGL